MLLLIVSVLITVTTAAIVSKAWVPGSAHAGQLGSMSERWLAEHRAAHAS